MLVTATDISVDVDTGASDVPPYIGIDCALAGEGTSVRIHRGGPGDTGPALLDVALPQGERNPVVLQSTTEDVVTAHRDRDVYVEIDGAGGTARGDISGCLEDAGTACLHDRLEVVAVPEDALGFEIHGSADRLSDALGFFSFTTFTVDGETKDDLFGASVRLRDRCAESGRYEAWIRRHRSATVTNPDGPVLDGIDQVEVTVRDMQTGREVAYTLGPGERETEDLGTFVCE